VTVDEGQTATNTGTVSDPDGDPVTLGASVGTVIDNNDGTWSWSFPTNDGPADSQSVTIDASDGRGGIAQIPFSLQVYNVAPTVDSIIAPSDPVDIDNDQPIMVTVNFSDPAGVYDELYECAFDYDDDGLPDETVMGVTGSSCSGTHAFADAGVYRVNVAVTDKDGGTTTASYEFVVVFDPNGPFVTGGGWIDSPLGAYAPDPTLTGRANFGFVSKYKPRSTRPSGNTEFQFQTADLNFRSSDYDWLIVSGAKARYKGTGTINGAGNYGFMLTAVDENLTPSTDVDLFRIKIWDKDNADAVVYDNQLGADDDADLTTEIQGGQIMIHTRHGNR
jgi:hypothetical protein